MCVCLHRGKHNADFAGSFGTVVASDCLYDDDASPLFCTMLRDVCKPGDVVMMSYKKRLPECVE